MLLKRSLAVLSALAALLLGLEKVGVFRLVPAGDVGFRAVAERLRDGREALLLHSDVGDLSCWIRLVVRLGAASSGGWEASMSSGEALAVFVENVDATHERVSISKAPDAQKQDPFTWRAGSPVRVVRTGAPTGPLTLSDWAVYATTQPSDTARKALIRTWWTRISWVLLVLALGGAALTAWPKREEPQAVGSLALVRSIVSTIEGTDAEQTALLRRFLTKVLLEGVPVREALDALNIPSTPYHVRPQFRGRARRVFLDRVSTVKQDLDALGERLNVHV
jgi:hypothetical protein